MNRAARAAASMMFAVGLGMAAAGAGLAQDSVKITHGHSLFGDLKYGPGFTHFDYVNPDAPKGGSIKQYAIGSFDSLNPFILKGRSATGIGRLFETLMTGSADEPSSEYGLLASSVETPEDLSWVIFNLRPEARWHDGTPVTAEDVVFSLEALKGRGHPFYRQYYANVVNAEALSPTRVKFTFEGGMNRELPQIIGQIPVLSKAYYEENEFDETTLEPPMGSGPYRISAVEPGRSITYERVTDYWGVDLPVNKGQNNFDEIRIDYYRDQTVALEAFKAHAYDFRSENSSKDWATGYNFPALENGLVIKQLIRHENPTGMQAFVFNTRRTMFADRKVRQALAYAYDFDWANTNLFYGQYTRTESFFSNSELAATGTPSDAELEYLNRFRGQVPEEVFTNEYRAPATDGSGNVRGNLRIAVGLLRDAGWDVVDGALTDSATGEKMVIEFLLVSPAFERIVAPYIQNLERLGVEATIRTIDSAQYTNRLEGFDFDVVVSTFGQSLSPGNEQRDFWGSTNADVDGSRNLIGVKDPVVDALIDDIIAAPDRQSLVASSQALDRVLLWGHYVVPQWHIRSFRVAYWDRFGRPDITPKYGLGFNAWWIDAAKDAALRGGEGELTDN
jgi:microcin C transport system substrate-binding protein